MSPKPILPQELVEHIIDQLYDDLAALESCSLVSRSWRPRSQYRRFRIVEVRRTRTLEQWADVCGLGSIIAASIHTLCLRVISSYPGVPTSALFFVNLLAQLPSLHTLSIQNLALGPYTLGNPLQAHCPNLQSLELGLTDLPDTTRMMSLFWHTPLACLRIDGCCSLTSEGSSEENALPTCWSVGSLVIGDNTSAVNDYLFDMFRRIFPCDSLASLEIIQLPTNYKDAQGKLIAFIEWVGFSLRDFRWDVTHLYLPLPSSMSSSPSATRQLTDLILLAMWSLLSMCTSLQTLHLFLRRFYPQELWEPVKHMTASLPILILPYTPPTIQILILSIQRTIEKSHAFLRHWTDNVDWSALETALLTHFENLREVRVVTETLLPPHFCKTRDEAIPLEPQLQIARAMPKLHDRGILRFPRPPFRGYS